MILVEEDLCVDSNFAMIHSFLNTVEYRKHNLWPNINSSKVQEFLSDEINRVSKYQKTFFAVNDGEILTFLSLRSLPWDSGHFGFPCATIDLLLHSGGCDNRIIEEALVQTLARLEVYMINKGIKFASLSVDSLDVLTTVALQKGKFRYVITWIDGLLPGGVYKQPSSSEFEFGIVEESELPTLKHIASHNYFDGGRFYLDKGFNNQAVDEMYGNLIESSFRDGKIMLSLKNKGCPIALFICNKITTYDKFSSLRVAPLRFLVVDPKYRSIKAGELIFKETLNYLSPMCDIITTGLEIHNLKSMNIHSKLGFKFNYTHNVFHWWN